MKLFRGLGRKLRASIVHMSEERPDLKPDKRSPKLDGLQSIIIEGRLRWEKRVQEALMQ